MPEGPVRPSTIPAAPAPINKLRRCINDLGCRLAEVRDIACSNIRSLHGNVQSRPLTRLERRRTIRLWQSTSSFDTRSRSFEGSKDRQDDLTMRASLCAGIDEFTSELTRRC